MAGYEHWPEARVLRRIRLGPAHLPTAELVIARYDSVTRNCIREPVRPVSNYYIFSLDEHGEEINGSCEPTLADALAGAANTFGIKPDQWTIITEDDLPATPTSA